MRGTGGGAEVRVHRDGTGNIFAVNVEPRWRSTVQGACCGFSSINGDES